MGKAKSKPYDPAAHIRMADRVGVKVMEAPMIVPDPLALEPGDKIVVTRNLRDDPLGERHARGIIDEAQYRGGRDYQRDFEQAGAGTRAIDFTREAVDGGAPIDPLPLARMKATDRLSEAHKALGLDGTAIAQDVLVGGFSMAVIAARRGFSGKAWEEYFGKRFRECLDCLAIVYNYSDRRARELTPGPNDAKG